MFDQVANSQDSAGYRRTPLKTLPFYAKDGRVCYVVYFAKNNVLKNAKNKFFYERKLFYFYLNMKTHSLLPTEYSMILFNYSTFLFSRIF